MILVPKRLFPQPAAFVRSVHGVTVGISGGDKPLPYSNGIHLKTQGRGSSPPLRLLHAVPCQKNIRLPRPVFARPVHFSSQSIHTIDIHGFAHTPSSHRLSPRILRDLALVRGTTLYAWCIMPNHIHLRIQDRDVVDFERLLEGRAAPRGRALESERRLWQRSFFDHALRKKEDVHSAACYV